LNAQTSQAQNLKSLADLKPKTPATNQWRGPFFLTLAISNTLKQRSLMNTENSDSSPNQSLGSTQAKQIEIQTILHQLIRMLAIEIANKIKSTQT
jgi:hypothetical protein